LDVVRALVAFGANVNERNKYNQTPWDTAQFMHKDDVMKFLREMGGAGGHIPNYVNSPIQEQGHNLENEDGPRDDGVLFGEKGGKGEGISQLEKKIAAIIITRLDFQAYTRLLLDYFHASFAPYL
jgi:ankyrin repeat protein